MDISVRPDCDDDRNAIRGVHRAAFNSDVEANLVDALRAGGHVVASLVAEVDEGIVGHILFSRVTIEVAGGTADALSLAPMAVVPPFQGQGVGSRLVEEGLKVCRASGHRSVFVLGHPDFYPRFGFSAERARSIASVFGGGTAWMALELMPGALDGLQGRVVYSPPFHALE